MCCVLLFTFFFVFRKANAQFLHEHEFSCYTHITSVGTLNLHCETVSTLADGFPFLLVTSQCF